ncbi:hypothetical protein FHS24_000596 [Psychrobacter luti]|uniref:Uncharacterized protein n=1 Tax=Psychrobacter luti TaxID=198481 RepID=A0A839TDI9_9GAMM|nr:hypothetical protein [Psychrobacter luti]MBB3106105.1 hypothetical protein [Psychrobacter luti]
MSISSRKINTMIEDEFLAKDYGAENSKLLINLSKTIYAMEASIAGQSNSKKIEEIRAKIDAKSDDFIVK